MTAPRRGRPPKPPDEVRTVRVTVLLDDREHATLLRSCGGRGLATMLREAGLREADEDARTRHDDADAGVVAEADAMIAQVDVALKRGAT